MGDMDDGMKRLYFVIVPSDGVQDVLTKVGNMTLQDRVSTWPLPWPACVFHVLHFDI